MQEHAFETKICKKPKEKGLQEPMESKIHVAENRHIIFIHIFYTYHLQR